MPTMGAWKLAHHACLACGGRSEVGGNSGLLGPVECTSVLQCSGGLDTCSIVGWKVGKGKGKGKCMR